MTDATGENSGNCKNGKSDEGGKSGKLQPKLRFKGFTDAWEQRALGELATFAKGAGYSKSDLVGKGKPIILYGRLYTDYQTIIHDVNTFVIDRPGSIYSVGNEVIVPASGETAEDIARASVVCRAGIILGGDLNIIYPKPSLSSVFLALVISNGKEHVKLARKAQGKSIVHIHNNDLKYIRISYPDIREQMTVSHLFRCFDCLIAAAERKARLLRKKKHAYLNHIFTQHLRFTGHTTPWQTKKLGNIADIVGGGTPSTIRPEYWDGGIQWFTPAEITKAQAYVSNSTKTITELGLSKSSARLLPGNRTILFTSRASIGETALLTVDATTNQGFQSIVLKDGINRYFIYCMVSNLRRYAQRMASGSTFLEISNHQLAKAPVYIPDSSEQAEIARFFQTLDSLIAAAERKVNLLKKKKQAYLQKMFI